MVWAKTRTRMSAKRNSQEDGETGSSGRPDIGPSEQRQKVEWVM